MKMTGDFEFPPEQRKALRRAEWLEWITLAYLASVIFVMWLVMGSSQAMRTAWLEDCLSLIPPIVFLIAAKVAVWSPTKRFPYGFHRAVSIAFRCAALALLTLGLILLVESIIKLATAEHPTIGGIHLFGRTIWQGWPMLAALVYSALPVVVLGRMKLPLAKKIHDKVLFADANMNKADWLTAAAAMIGVLGVGAGFWWADAVAAAIISLDITYDGIKQVRRVVGDLMDESPKTVDHSQLHKLPEKLAAYLESLPWIDRASVRLREEGHVFFGEAYVVVNDITDLPQRLAQAADECRQLDWRMHDLAVAAVPSLEAHETNVRRPKNREFGNYA